VQSTQNKLTNITATKIKKSKTALFAKGKANLELLILCLPAVLCFFIFNYLPMIGTIIAFKDYHYDLGILGSKWVGFENFKFFFTSQDAFRITRNTLGYGALFILASLITSVLVALLLFEIKKKIAIKFYQTTMILPFFISWVIVGFIAYSLLSPNTGVINQLLSLFNIAPIGWYSDPKYWPYILTIAHIWKGVGMNSVVYYAALMGIDHELFEAATLDGANRVQQTMAISVPTLIPLMTMLSILGLGNIFRGDFGLFYQLPRDIGALYSTTDVIDTYLYRGLRTGDNIGMTAAVGLFQSVVGLCTVVAANWVVKKINPENTLY